MKVTFTVALKHFIAISLSCVSLLASAVTVTVPGTSNLWLAGMPAGTTAPGGDSAPAQSPVLISGLNLGWGGYLTFTNGSGTVGHDPSCPVSCGPTPDGRVGDWSTQFASNGISGVYAPYNSLIAVFLDDSQPNLSAAPASLLSGVGMNFTTLSPLLKQVFFVGDGKTSGGTVQIFNVPTGATRLFLGTFDGSQWVNNIGAFTIDVTQIADAPAEVPEPSSTMLVLLALFVLLSFNRKSLSSAKAK